jgi:hypothetical protein
MYATFVAGMMGAPGAPPADEAALRKIVNVHPLW